MADTIRAIDDTSINAVDDNTPVRAVEGSGPDLNNNQFEQVLTSEAQRLQTAQATAQQLKAQQQQDQAAAAADPKNWTLDQTKKIIKAQPPRTIQEEGSAAALLQQKKDQVNAVKDKISGKPPKEEIYQAPPPNMFQKIGAKIEKVLGDAGIIESPEFKQAKAMNAYAISKNNNIPLQTVMDHYDTFAFDPKYTGLHSLPFSGSPAEGGGPMRDTLATLNSVMTPAVIGALVTAPAVTVPALAVYGITNAAISKVEGLDKKQLTPEARAGIEILNMIGSGGVGGVGGHISGKVLVDKFPSLAKYSDFWHGLLSKTPPSTQLAEDAAKETVQKTTDQQSQSAAGPAPATAASEIRTAPAEVAATDQPAPVKAGDLATVNGKTVSVQKVQDGQAHVVIDGAHQTIPVEDIHPLDHPDITQLPEVVAARERAAAIPKTVAINTPEREILRQKIIDSFYGDGARVKDKQADIVLGGPAAGKGQIVDPLLAQHGGMLIDSDVYKTALPEYQNGVGAAAVHEESSHIIERKIFEKAVQNGDNIVLPRLGKNPKTIEKIVNDLKANGYKVHVHLVDLPLEKSMKRSVNRFLETGRFVDPLYVQEVGLTPHQTYAMLKTKGVDSYAKYSTDVPKGTKPILTESNDASTQRLGQSLGQLVGPAGSATPGIGETGSSGSLKEPQDKTRKFITTVRESPQTASEVAKTVDSKYTPISNKETLNAAQEFVKADYNKAVELVEGPTRTDTFQNAVAQLLIRRAQDEGRMADAVRLVERTAEKQTELGQAIQALSIYNRLSPEGILMLAQRTVNRARADIKQKSRTTNFDKLAKDLSGPDKDKLAEKLGIPHISDIVAGELKRMADQIQKMPEGRPKDLETAKMLKKISDQVPRGLGDKISMIQTMAQLLNPKTFVRNLLGNVVFQAAENMSDLFGTALDIAVSLRTGQRTVFPPKLGIQLSGMKQGFGEGYEEAVHGVNLKNTQSKFTLPKNGVFDKGVLGALEKTLRVSLGATDRAFYQGAFNQSLREQTLAAGIEEPDERMIEKAHLIGLYRTFQDDNVISNQFVRLKHWFNNWTVDVPWLGGRFGMGDLVIKYPKTPANIMARGIEYSPFGFIKAVMKLAQPLAGEEFNQDDFVRFTSRAFTGTALMVGTGAMLGALGIISGARTKDKDVATTRENVGIREYQLNVSALKRFVFSGLDPVQAKIQPGDVLITYDWMQPSSISVALGANMVLNPKNGLVDKVMNLGDQMLQASETLQQQPLVSGLKVLTGKQDITKGISDTLKEIPASFVPTLLSQIRQLSDNIARNTKDPNYFKEMYNKAINRVPVADQTLPPRITTLGQPKEMYQLGTNNPFNVFLNPAFVSKYNPDPVSRMVLDIWENSGQTAQFPRLASTKIKFGKQAAGGPSPEPIELNPSQYMEYQKYIGNRTDVLFTLLSNRSGFMGLQDEEKAHLLQGFLTDINNAAKIEVLGDRPKHITKDTLAIIQLIGKNKKQIDLNELKSKTDPSQQQDTGIRSIDDL